MAQLKSPRGAKTEQVEAAVMAFIGTFTIYELERACLGVSRDMVRKVLRDLQKAGFVECLGRGPGAVWRKKGNTLFFAKLPQDLGPDILRNRPFVDPLALFAPYLG